MFDKQGEFSPDPKAANFLKMVNKKARDLIKPIVLAIPYGATAYQVAAMLDKKKFVSYTKKDGTLVEYETYDTEYGQYIINTYLNEYKDLHKYMLNMEIQALTKGYVSSLFGRRRHFQFTVPVFNLLSSKGIEYTDFVSCNNKQLKNISCSFTLASGDSIHLSALELKEICRQTGLNYYSIKDKGAWDFIKSKFKEELNNAKNCPIQTLAGHIANRAMLEVCRAFKKGNINGWLAIQVHDELTTYVETSQVELGSKYLQISMEKNEFTNKIDIPMIAEPIICDNLKESK
jgi:DNA polymerase I-like protein with 3'-5' exonuclease and polymerase domains